MHTNTKKGSLRVRDIMKRPVIASRESESIRSVASKMSKHGIGSVVIVSSESKATGIITQGDIVRHLAIIPGTRLQSMKAHEIMSKPLKFIGAEEKIEEAANAMIEYKVKRLCVLDESKTLIGIVTDNDVMRNAGYMMNVLDALVAIRHPTFEMGPEELVLAEEEKEKEISGEE